MTNGDLIKILQRFPAEGHVKIRRHEARQTPAELNDIDRAEMAIDPSPMVLSDQNIGWSDLAKERIQVVLVFGSPKDAAAPAASPATP